MWFFRLEGLSTQQHSQGNLRRFFCLGTGIWPPEMVIYHLVVKTVNWKNPINGGMNGKINSSHARFSSWLLEPLEMDMSLSGSGWCPIYGSFLHISWGTWFSPCSFPVFPKVFGQTPRVSVREAKNCHQFEATDSHSTKPKDSTKFGHAQYETIVN